jgi:hypothetical protein
MTAPNLIAVTTINGKTSGVSLTTTATTVVLNNAPASGKCLKVNTLNVANITTTSTNITISWYTNAGLGGTGFAIASNISVPGGSTLNIVDKSSQYYLEENTSLGATASSANALVVTTSYEDIS